MNRGVAKVMWRFEGYITSTQSGFSTNRGVHGQGTVEVFRAITTRERAVKNEENLFTKGARKMYSPKKREKRTHQKNEQNVLTKTKRKHTHLPTVGFLPENGLF